MRSFSTCAAIALTFSLSACGQEDTQTDALAPAAEKKPASEAIPCQSDGITVSDAWIRSARAGQPTTAAYLTICNGGAPDTLLSVEYSGAAAVEIHTTSMGENGAMIMSPSAAGIRLPSGELVKLEPGGAHVMLIGVTYALTENESVPMTLTFSHADAKEVIFHVHSAIDESGDHGEH